MTSHSENTLINEDDHVEYSSHSELSYSDNGEETVELFVNGESAGWVEVWTDRFDDGEIREYICLNHVIIYLETLRRE